MTPRGKTVDPARLARLWRPNQAERERIVAGLLKLQASPRRPFESIWLNGPRLMCRFQLCGDREYLPWSEAKALVDTVAMIKAKV